MSPPQPTPKLPRVWAPELNQPGSGRCQHESGLSSLFHPPLATQLLFWAWGRDEGRGEARWVLGHQTLGSRCLRTCPREMVSAGPRVNRGSKPLGPAPKFHWTLFTKVKLSTISRRQQQNIKQSIKQAFRARGPGCLHRSQARDTSPNPLPSSRTEPSNCLLNCPMPTGESWTSLQARGK